MTVENQLRALLEAAWQTLAHQQQEVDVVVEQARLEVARESEKVAELRAKVEALERTLDRYSREELLSLFQAAKDREMRLVVRQAELEGLEYKRAVLTEDARMLARFGALLDSGAAPADRGQPDRPDGARSGVAAASSTGGNGPAAADLGALLLAQEADRTRLAHWLHDRVAQPLHNMALQVELWERWVKTDPRRAAEELEGLRLVACKVLQDAKRAIFELRPMSLDDLGLLPTLERYLQLRSEEEHLVGRLQQHGRPRQLPAAVETAIFRIVEAALDNVRDHSGVSDALINLTYTDRELTVTISDAGRGCNLRLVQTNLQGGAGLLGMRERARQVAGSIEFDSSPGRGMMVRLTVPLAGLPPSRGHRRSAAGGA